jgi:periplasmic divalent cation tolerance protein
MDSWRCILARAKRKGEAARAVEEKSMKKASRMRVVLVTCPTLKEGRHIARTVVLKRLAACVNIVLSPAESIYTWKGKLEQSREFLLIVKTTERCLGRLEEQIKKLHSYEVPEFLVLPVVAGSREYLAWLNRSVAED